MPLCRRNRLIHSFCYNYVVSDLSFTFCNFSKNETKHGFTAYTHNIDLKKRLIAFAAQHPVHCTMTDEDTETGYKSVEIDKGQVSFRLTAPYREERKQAASEWARKYSIPSSSKILQEGYSMLYSCIFQETIELFLCPQYNIIELVSAEREE